MLRCWYFYYVLRIPVLSDKHRYCYEMQSIVILKGGGNTYARTDGQSKGWWIVSSINCYALQPKTWAVQVYTRIPESVSQPASQARHRIWSQAKYQPNQANLLPDSAASAHAKTSSHCQSYITAKLLKSHIVVRRNPGNLIVMIQVL